MEEKLVQLRHMVVTALFVNYKLSEDPIMRSTLDELLKPLVITELKSFMLLLTKTPRKFRSVLELVSDVVEEIVKGRFDTQEQNSVVKALQTKFDALIDFAHKEITQSSFSDEIEFLSSLDVAKLKEKDALLFSHQELYIINKNGFKALLLLHKDEPFLFQKRVMDALTAYQMETFAQNNVLSSQNKKTALEDVNRPEIIETLADDKRV
jgi:hypothetical protein